MSCPAGASGGGALSADGSVITATVLLKGDVGERQQASASLNEHLAKDMPAGINAAMAGNSPLMGDLTEVEGHDMMTAEMVGLPLAFIVLLLAQRSVLAAMMPMVLGMCAVGSLSACCRFGVPHGLERIRRVVRGDDGPCDRDRLLVADRAALP